MDDNVKKYLPFIVLVIIIAVLNCIYGMMMVHEHVDVIDAWSFSWQAIFVPCAQMFIAPLIIMLLVKHLNAKRYAIIVVACLVVGIVSTCVVSGWQSDPAIVGQLLVNSKEKVALEPILESPLLIARNLVAFVVCPTLGALLGSFLGKRLLRPGKK